MNKPHRISVKSKMRIKYYQLRLSSTKFFQNFLQKQEKSNANVAFAFHDHQKQFPDYGVQSQCTDENKKGNEAVSEEETNETASSANVSNKTELSSQYSNISKYYASKTSLDTMSGISNISPRNKLNQEPNIKNIFSKDEYHNQVLYKKTCSRHVRFPDELPHFVMSSDSFRPFTARTISSDESVHSRILTRRERMKTRQRRSSRTNSQRNRRYLDGFPDITATEGDCKVPTTHDDSNTFKDQVSGNSILEREIDFTFAHKIDKENNIILEEEDEDIDHMSPGQVVSSSLTLPKESKSSESLSHIVTRTVSTTLIERPSLVPVTSPFGLPVVSTNKQIIDSTDKPKTQGTSTKSKALGGFSKIFRKNDASVKFKESNKKSLQIHKEKQISKNKTGKQKDTTIEFPKLKAKLVALTNRRRDPVVFEKPSQRIEFGMKFVFNSSPVRHHRAKYRAKKAKKLADLERKKIPVKIQSKVKSSEDKDTTNRETGILSKYIHGFFPQEVFAEQSVNSRISPQVNETRSTGNGIPFIKESTTFPIDLKFNRGHVGLISPTYKYNPNSFSTEIDTVVTTNDKQDKDKLTDPNYSFTAEFRSLLR